MKTISRFSAMVALLLLAASGAQATVLYTIPALRTYPTNQTLYCDIFNLGTKPVDVTIEIYDMDGVLVGSSAPFSLSPNSGDAYANLTTGAYCKFTTSASKKYVRAVAVYDNGTDYTMGIAAR